MRNLIPNFSECYKFLIKCSGFFGKGNISFFSENIKCGNLKKNRVIYHNEKNGNNLIFFWMILSNKITLIMCQQREGNAHLWLSPHLLYVII